MDLCTRAGEAKLVLTWGAKPKDLDIYVLAPHSNPSLPPCEVNWRAKKCHSKTVTLDRDDTQGHGPETISLQNFNPGTYIVRIDEYRGNPRNSQMVAGHATVAYYAPHVGGMFNIVGSTGSMEGRVWYAIAIDGTTRQPIACTPELCPVRPQPRD
jgi:adhesin/invasin